MAINVNTEAHILVFATNCDILQNSVPKGQFEFNMYTKLSVVFNVDTIASAIDKFTEMREKLNWNLLILLDFISQNFINERILLEDFS